MANTLIDCPYCGESFTESRDAHNLVCKRLPPADTRFKPGQSGNPAGKPKNSRNRLTVAFLNALANDFETHGVNAIKEARQKDPVGYVKAIAQLMPKQVEQSQPLDDLTDAELVAGIALLRSRLAGGAGEGSDTPPSPSQVN